jgi:glycosyltransferase involved in cell wall biosynthesis
MKKIFAVQTRYTHWSSYSGYQGFIPFLSKEHTVSHDRIPYGAKKYHALPVLNKIVQSSVRASGLALYSPNDLAMELTLFLRSVAYRPDAVHFLDGEHAYRYFSSYVKPLRLIQGGSPKIIVSYHLPPQRLIACLKRYAHLARADTIVLVGSSQYDFFQKHVAADRITVLPHGVNTAFFKPANRIRPGANELFTCLCIGNHLRDYQFLLRVAEQLQEFTAIRFRVISGAPEALALSHVRNVQVESGLSDAQLLAAYQQADILTMPLIDTTANNVILEAMACGLPILTTDVGSIRDYAEETFAMLFTPQDTRNYADALVALSCNAVHVATMGKAARMHAEEHLSWAKLAASYERLYS